jgi:hypothetical protein
MRLQLSVLLTQDAVAAGTNKSVEARLNLN